MQRSAAINGIVLVRDDQDLLGAIAELRLFGFDVALAPGAVAQISGGVSGRNVMAYGARGNGIADDTAAIQAANDVGPGVVDFPPGTYRFTQVTRGSGVTWRGAGVGATTLISSFAGPLIQSPAPAYAASPTVRAGGIFDMLIDGTDRTIGGGVGINMSQNFNATVARVTVQNCERGVALQNSAYWNVLQSVRCANVDIGLDVTNNANSNLLLDCNVLASERGLQVTEGPDRGCSVLVAVGLSVEQFTSAAVYLEATTPNAIDVVRIDAPRIENAALVAALPGIQVVGTCRNVTVNDPLTPNIDPTTLIVGANSDTVVMWRGQEKIGGVRIPVAGDFTTTSHGRLLWSASAQRAFLRNSANSVYEPLQCDGVFMANGAYFTSFAGDPNGSVTAGRGSLCSDSLTGDLYRKTTTTGSTGWVTP